MSFDLPFAAYGNYHSSSNSQQAVLSRKVRGALKSGDQGVLKKLAERLQEDEANVIHPFIGGDRYLVPVPGSGKTTEGNFWGPRVLCEALHENGIGSGVLSLVERAHGVQKSSTAGAGMRPTTRQHFDSMAAQTDLTTPVKITLVDDIVTLGATMMGAAQRLLSVHPNAEIKLLAMLRTRNFDDDIAAFKEPTVGTIKYFEQSGKVWRDDEE